jgi:hypothetical protein
VKELKRLVFSGLTLFFICLLLSTHLAWAQSEGEWSGTTNQGGNVFFIVSGNNVQNFSIEICVSGGSGGFGCFEEYMDFSMPISGSNFSHSNFQFELAGTFTSSNTCTGTWAFHDGYMGYGNGIWSASFPASPYITLSPSAQAFENQTVNTTSESIKFTLTNKEGGTATGSVSLTGTNTDQFEITSGGGSFLLTHGQSKDIYVRFVPTSVGSKTATLIVDGNLPCNDINALLEGTGVYPVLSVTPNYQMVPADSGATTFIVSNEGESPSILSWTTEVDPSDTWLTISNGSSGIQGGTITVDYETNVGDARIGTIYITADDAFNSPQTILVLQVANRWYTKMIASDKETGDHFGYSVSISGDYAIVGAYGDDDNGNDSGSAYIFERMGIEWSQKAKLTPDDGATDDHFGYSVSISGDYAIVGAPLDDDNGYNSGSAYVFQKPLDSWTDMTETAKLTASDGYGHHDPYVPVSDNFGRSVNISENYAIVGAYGLFRDGSAYIFKQPVGGWEDMTETAKLTPSDEDTILEVPNFGRSVCISGVFAVVGADNNSFGSHAYDGAAYVFQQPLDGWTDMTETAKLKASDGSSTFQNDFGFSVCISGDYLIAGARLDDENGSESGSAYIFKQPVGGWENMTETAKLIARDSVSGDHFGGSVSMSGDYVIIGASGNESAYIYFIGNFQPKISIINNIIINENTQTDSISFTVLDSETLPEDLLITGISSNNILVPNENIVFEGTDVNRTLTITPVPNEVGATTITVTLSDGMDTVSESFLFTVLDTDGDDLLNMGQTTIDHDWKTINLSSTLQNAIYILSPPTYHGTDPGVVRLQNVTNNSFDIRFQEWLYKDGQRKHLGSGYVFLVRHRSLERTVF